MDLERTDKEEMKHSIAADVKDLIAAGLPLPGALVYCVLRDTVTQEEGSPSFTFDGLAEASGIPARTFRRWAKVLETMGAIIPVRQSRGKKWEFPGLDALARRDTSGPERSATGGQSQPERSATGGQSQPERSATGGQSQEQNTPNGGAYYMFLPDPAGSGRKKKREENLISPEGRSVVPELMEAILQQGREEDRWLNDAGE